MEPIAVGDLMTNTVLQMYMILQNLVGIPDQSNGLHPLVESSISWKTKIDSMPVGTLMLVINGGAGFVIFALIFNSWTIFKNWVKSVEVGLSPVEEHDDE